ncbi:hypothetical protein P43SY_004184 [Pythium insidiosum]|uniref:Uncharacterized protein n=1 Tax=Pythium insidiosum TaxID=114742 RepID=A0AAD5M223_PYTIN|nr:hypothetical protein P43SY_004184 [Pythium insidiosum]
MAVAVEQFVKTQLKEISAISSLVSDFTVAHERYAHEYAKLPVASSPVLSSATGSDDLAMPSGLERILDIAQSVMDAVVQANVMIAQELQSAVLGPLEAFRKQQQRQTKQLLEEIEESLSKEKQYHAGIRHVLAKLQETSGDEGQMKRGLAALLHRQPSSGSGPQGGSSSLCDENNQGQQDDETDLRKREERQSTLRELRAKRDQERAVVRQRLHELELTAEQQRAVIAGILQRMFDTFEQQLTPLREKISSFTPTSRNSITEAAPVSQLVETEQPSQSDAIAAALTSVTNVKAKAEASGMEREVSDLRDYLAVIKRNEATQRADTIKTLGHTSLVGVKTMELMVNDHVKNLMKALGILSEAVANCQRRVQVRAARVADSTAAGVDMSPLTVAFEDDADIIGAALGESEGQLAGAKEGPDDGKRGLTNTEAPEQIDNEVGNNAAEMIEDQVNRTDHVVRSKSHETNRGVIYQAFKRKMPTDCAT